MHTLAFCQLTNTFCSQLKTHAWPACIYREHKHWRKEQFKLNRTTFTLITHNEMQTYSDSNQRRCWFKALLTLTWCWWVTLPPELHGHGAAEIASLPSQERKGAGGSSITSRLQLLRNWILPVLLDLLSPNISHSYCAPRLWEKAFQLV